jgi:hypothetical protein
VAWLITLEDIDDKSANAGRGPPHLMIVRGNVRREPPLGVRAHRQRISVQPGGSPLCGGWLADYLLVERPRYEGAVDVLQVDEPSLSAAHLNKEDPEEPVSDQLGRSEKSMVGR